MQGFSRFLSLHVTKPGRKYKQKLSYGYHPFMKAETVGKHKISPCLTLRLLFLK